MSTQTELAGRRPWTRLYTGRGLPAEAAAPDALTLFRRAVARAPDAPGIHYFDTSLSYATLDGMSDALAAALVDGGFAPGDRLGIYMQNMPQFVIAMLATWKAGGIAVPISPMSRAFELGKLLPDCRPTVIVAMDDLLSPLREAIAGMEGYAPRVIATSPRRLQSRNDARVLPAVTAGEAVPDLMDFIAAAQGRRPEGLGTPDGTATALLVYTSGTTGTPKGAMITHANLTAQARAMQAWFGLEHGMGPVLALAPLFHVTGLAGHIALAWQLVEALVLTYRFQPEVMLDAIAEYRPAFTAGAITAYIAMMNSPASSRQAWASFHALVSGGAPMAPAVAEAFETHSGRYLHNGYGLTETAAGVVSVPMGASAPVDEESGSLSIGLPKYDVDLWIAGEDGERLGIGEIGEIVLSGPSVSPGYWNRPAETAEAMRADGFRTGDVGLMDAAGWVYLVDRKKDMINASGFKVWPREVEDMLYAHPAVREAAVVGVPDPYRGETVRAVVSLREGETAEPGEFIAWCRTRIAPYKVPREVLIIDELPKTPTGKILRRSLRD